MTFRTESANEFRMHPSGGSALTAPGNSGIVTVVHAQSGSRNGKARTGGRWRRVLRWFEPGLGLKRWLALMVLGTALIGLGLAILLLDIYRAHPDSPWLAVLSLRALPRWVRALLFGGSGVFLLVLAVVKLNRSLLAPYLQPGKSVLEVVANHRRLEKGPNVVAIGGGTGLSTLLRGLKQSTSNLTAIVTMADDGGSSGRLRKELGIPPPGDLRNCLAALSDDEAVITRLFQYRFQAEGGLEGHSFGNLFIAALSGAMGSFDRGILEVGKILPLRGQVLPSTLSDVALVADKLPAFHHQAVRIEGESRIPDVPGQIRRVQLEPVDPPAHPQALRAVLNAQMIVIGPGSLFTSIIPNLLVPDLVQAIRASRAFKVFVCNVATQRGETENYNCAQHYLALESHVGPGLVDLVLANDAQKGELPQGVMWVEPPTGHLPGVPVHTADLVDEEQPWRHDPLKLSETLMALLEERTGPLDNGAGQRGSARA